MYLLFTTLNLCDLQTPNPRVSSGLTSTSLDRAPGPSKSFVRGKSGYVPFWPGGLDDVLADTGDSLGPDKKGLRTIPPGFSRGLRLPGDELEDDILMELDEISGKHIDDTVFTFVVRRPNRVCSVSEFCRTMPTRTSTKNEKFRFQARYQRSTTCYLQQ